MHCCCCDVVALIVSARSSEIGGVVLLAVGAPGLKGRMAKLGQLGRTARRARKALPVGATTSLLRLRWLLVCRRVVVLAVHVGIVGECGDSSRVWRGGVGGRCGEAGSEESGPCEGVHTGQGALWVAACRSSRVVQQA
jgi:hypothetical protein